MAGGPATYAFDAFGPFAGMQASLWYWASCLIGNVAIATAASGYLAAFFGSQPARRMGAFITIALLWLVTVVNLVSPRFVGQVDGPLLVAGLVPLLLVATVGWFWFDAGAVPRVLECQRPVRSTRRVPHSLVLVFWAFTGPRERIGGRGRGRESRTQCAASPPSPGVLHRRTHLYSGQRGHHGPGARAASSPIPRRRSRWWPRKMFGPGAVPLVASAPAC